MSLTDFKSEDLKSRVEALEGSKIKYKDISISGVAVTKGSTEKGGFFFLTQ